MRIRFLGTGGTEGIPAIGCECRTCTRAWEQQGRHLRGCPAILFSLPGYELLIDTPPDIRGLFNTFHIDKIDGIFITHEHFDHIAGLDYFFNWGEGFDLFVEPGVYQKLVREYWSEDERNVASHFALHPGATIQFSDFLLIPFRVRHTVPCYGLAIIEDDRRVIHIADSDSGLSKYARKLIANADLLIANTPYLEPRDDEAHISMEEAVALKEETSAKQLILTHVTHNNQPYDELEAFASEFEGVTLAYDGMVVNV